MSELSEFAKVIAEGKRKAEEAKLAAKADLSDFAKVIAEGKKKYELEDPKGILLKQVKENAKNDLGALFEQLGKSIDVPEPIVEPIVEEVLIEVAPVAPEVRPASQMVSKSEIDKYLTDKSFQQPNPDTVDPNIKAIQDKLKFMEQWLGKIAATGPGGGEVNLRWLDDVDRPSIYDMRYLRYNDSKKKFEFAEVNPHDIVYNTYLVTTPTYTVSDEDYYIGVNYNGPTTITLPTTPSSGRIIIIKDESGNAETNPITVNGTVDNDAGGFIIQINNGAIQMIYRNGWRII